MKRFFSFLMFLLFLSACSTNDITSETATGQEIPVYVNAVQEINIEQQLELSGQVLPGKIIPLVTTTPSNVKAVFKKVGDKVHIGDEILKLDDEIIKTQAQQAQKAVTELEKGLQAAKDLQLSVESEMREFEKAQQQLENSIEESRQLISSLSNEDEDVTLLNVIQQSLEVSLQQAELAQVAGKFSNFPSINTAELEMQLDLAKENARQAEKLVEATTVTSPINGTISEINVTENQIAMPNIALTTVVSLNPVVATFHVNSYQVVQLKEKMTATLLIEGLNEEFQSEISVVSPTINPQTNLFKVEIPLTNEEETIKGGMRVTAFISLGSIEKANVIPIDSILYDENSPYVFVAQNGIAKRKDVVLGIRSGDLIEVHEGITKDELIVTRGKERLTNGVEIIVRNEE